MGWQENRLEGRRKRLEGKRKKMGAVAGAAIESMGVGMWRLLLWRNPQRKQGPGPAKNSAATTTAAHDFFPHASSRFEVVLGEDRIFCPSKCLNNGRLWAGCAMFMSHFVEGFFYIALKGVKMMGYQVPRSYPQISINTSVWRLTQPWLPCAPNFQVPKMEGSTYISCM